MKSELLNTPLSGESYVHPVTYIGDIEDAWEFLSIPQPLAIDVETTGLSDQDTITTVQFANNSHAFVFDPYQHPNMLRCMIQRLIEMDFGKPMLIAHNAAFDAQKIAKFLRTEFDDMEPLSTVDVLRLMTDTQILSRLVDPRGKKHGGIGHGLKALGDSFDPGASEGEKVLKNYMARNDKTWADMDMTDEPFVRYGGMDVILTARLWIRLSTRIEEMGIAHLVEFDHHVLRIVTEMRERGFKVDKDYTLSLSQELSVEAEEHRAIAASLGVANINSTQQVAEALTLRGHNLTKLTDKGAIKVDNRVLSSIDDDLARVILDARGINKTLKTWVNPIHEAAQFDGRVHPTINPSNALTGRMSISDPGLHQLPAGDHRVRSCLVADDNQTLISCDFSQVELRVAAALAYEPTMIDTFNQGGDIHSDTARRLFGEGFTKAQRGIAKSTAFGILYGGGAAMLAENAGISEGEARLTIDNFHRQFPRLQRWSFDVMQFIKDTRPCVVTRTGRQIPLSPQWAYKAVNYQVQSVAGDIFKQSLIDLDKAGLTKHLLLPIHDEVIAEAPHKDVAEVSREIEKTMSCDFDGVPIVAEAEIVGYRWGDKYAPHNRGD